MTTRRQATSPGGKQNRSVFLSFEFEKDAGRQRAFLSEAKEHCEFAIIDKSLPSAEHDDTWRREAKARIRRSDVVIVLLGPDTHNAPGVKDELSLAGEANCPVVQLMPQHRRYGLVAKGRSGLRVQMEEDRPDASRTEGVCQPSMNQDKANSQRAMRRQLRSSTKVNDRSNRSKRNAPPLASLRDFHA